MNEPYKRIEKELNGKTIRLSIYQDCDMAESPREWDNAGTMVCWHNRYTLGDEQPKSAFPDWLASLLEFRDERDDETTEQYHEALINEWEQGYIFFPLFLYDHSGISISMNNSYPYNDRWDAGQVGWVYISKEKAIKEWGKKRMTPTVLDKAIKCLEQEVKTYDQYLTGDIYGFMIEEKTVCDKGHTHWEDKDSCCGFYGSSPKENGMIEHWSKEYVELFKEAV